MKCKFSYLSECQKMSNFLHLKETDLIFWECTKSLWLFPIDYFIFVAMLFQIRSVQVSSLNWHFNVAHFKLKAEEGVKKPKSRGIVRTLLSPPPPVWQKPFFLLTFLPNPDPLQETK